MGRNKYSIRIDKETLAKIDKGNRRSARIEAGLNDGRFNTRAVKDKSKYSRKKKHKNLDY